MNKIHQSHLNLSFHEPASLLKGVENEMQRVSQEQLFNNPKYQKLKESWCASMFGLGIQKHVSPCEVAINNSNNRLDVDFYLKTPSGIWEFQLVEIQEPGRRRGLLYRQLSTLRRTLIPYEPERGRTEGPGWIANGVERKKAKNYAGKQSLNLLVYVNFTAHNLQYEALVRALSTYSDSFPSLWLVSSLTFCSIFSNSGIREVPGWAVIREISTYWE